jgi:hypothetical protein
MKRLYVLRRRDWIVERIPRTLRARGVAMHEAALNPGLIRVVLILLFLIITQVLHAMKVSKAAKPTVGADTGKRSPLETLGEAMREAAEQARAQQSEKLADGEPLQKKELFHQPSFQQSPRIESIQQAQPIQPESSWISSFLLLALLVCLFLMACRYWAG